jgi:Tol biopolymer transport system component
MPLSAGTRLGFYEILAPLGAGGMGEVYRATDTRLNRAVALKLLSPALAGDADYMARFTREAQVLASLNHPNIAAIYGLQDDAIVMELVEGPTLAERITAGPLPLEETLHIAKQIADALEAAHEKGIVHRDLKPANVKITAEGVVKVLDFGLAKAPELSPSISASSPTLTMRATQAGVIMGTAAYMSPEQASAKPVDKRADIWSYGVVLWEMLTGRELFSGETISHTLADVLRAEIDVSRLPAGTPQAIRELVRRCLDRDTKTRLRDIGEARIAIQRNLADPVGAAPSESKRSALPWLAAGVLAIVAAIALWAPWREPAAETHLLSLQVNPPPGAEFRLGGLLGGSAVSPDGRMIAFIAVADGASRVWVRPLDSPTARELPGTDEARQPFWSPDNQSIGFRSAGVNLKRVNVKGGAPVVISDDKLGPFGADWSTAGVILLGSARQGIFQVPASGGKLVPLTSLDPVREENSHRWPRFLPDGRRFLYWVQSAKPNLTGIYLGSLDRPAEKILLLENATGASYLPPRGGRPGYLIWLQGNKLTAQPFNPTSAQLSGEAAPVPGAEVVGFGAGNGLAYFSISGGGTLVYGGGSERYQLSWFKRDGTVLSTLHKVDDRYQGLRISPDGSRAAITVRDAEGNRDIWTLDLARSVESRISSGNHGSVSAWSPDGQRLAFSGSRQIFARSASGVGEEELLVQSGTTVWVNDWSPDGRYLMYTEASPQPRLDLMLLPLTGDRKPVPYLRTASSEMHGQFSPDGKWVAYSSAESGRNEVYVQSFPAGRDKWPVSNNGGAYPRWRRDGKELFYLTPENRVMAASVHAGPQGLEFGVPVALLRLGEPLGNFAFPYDVAPDGQRILALTPGGGPGDAATLTVLLNWESKLKK